jgi:mannose-6-phosphate isomerase-like protein (cupin superfamily)
LEFTAMTEQHSLQLISTDTAEHYIWGERCDGWFFLKSADVQVIQESMPAGTSEVKHYHRKSRQLFYVLRGQLTMQTGSAVRIPAGHAVVVEPMVAHQARNESPEPVEFLVISCPPSHGDRFDCK